MAHPSALLDTSILVDLSRGLSGAVQWMQSQTNTTFGFSVLVAMEMVEGTRDTADLRRVRKLITRFPVIHLTPADCEWAQQQHAQLHLSHNLGFVDALIAAPNVRLNIPLYTLNLKHFSPMPGIKALRPY